MSRPMVLAAAVALLVSCTPAQAQQQEMLSDALGAAIRTFERASGHLGAVAMGVDNAAYGDALRQQRFHAPTWGAVLDVHLMIEDSGDGVCGRFAAYVRPAIDNGSINLHFCPEFFSPGADELRETTILHEMVHVVMGPDECLAMAYTAKIQALAHGTFLPITNYWNKHNCDSSGYSLPE